MACLLVLTALLSAAANAGAATATARHKSDVERAGVVFPVTIAAGGHYLVDQAGSPFPILGRSAWFVLALSAADRRAFVEDTLARGYNAVEMLAITHDPRGRRPPRNGDGDLPFLRTLSGARWEGSLNNKSAAAEAPDFTAPNPAYWRFVDALLEECEARGILVFLFPAYVGYHGGEQGWMREMLANGPTRIRDYGAWLASRYRERKNIVWMMGGDFGKFSRQEDEVERGLLDGLRTAPGQQSPLISAEWDSDSIATDQSAFGPAMTLNGAYSWTGDVSSQGRRAYAHRPALPAYLLEEPYDEEGPDGNGVNPHATQPVRRFQWWGWLSTIGGYISGNGYVWPFAAPRWQDHLDTQGSRDMAKLDGFVRSIAWSELVPSGLDGMKGLVTKGGSTPSAADYVAAAATRSGTLLVAYVPPAHAGAVAIDMTALSGSVSARWVNPTSGESSPIGVFDNVGSRSFSPPGDNGTGFRDWVLVLEKR